MSFARCRSRYGNHGQQRQAARTCFGELSGWQSGTGSAVAEAVPEPASYGFAARITAPGGTGIPGGIGGDASYPGHVIFYVGVPDAEAALAEAGQLDGNAGWDPNGHRQAW